MRNRSGVGKGLLGSAPVEGTREEVVVLVLPDSKLLSIVLKGIEPL